MMMYRFLSIAYWIRLDYSEVVVRSNCPGFGLLERNEELTGATFEKEKMSLSAMLCLSCRQFHQLE